MKMRGVKYYCRQDQTRNDLIKNSFLKHRIIPKGIKANLEPDKGNEIIISESPLYQWMMMMVVVVVIADIIPLQLKI